jgi:hypothetical protein
VAALRSRQGASFRLLELLRDGRFEIAASVELVLERLAVLVPRPRVNLVLYHGVLAPRAAWRAEVVPGGAPVGRHRPPAPQAPRRVGARRAARAWAELMRRAFEIDVLACPRCHGRVRLVACIEAPAVTARILRHLGLPVELPVPRAARAAGSVCEAAEQPMEASRRPGRQGPITGIPSTGGR